MSDEKNTGNEKARQVTEKVGQQAEKLGKEAADVGKQAGTAATDSAKEVFAVAKGFKPADVIGQVKALATKPLGVLGIIKGSFCDPGGFFGKVREEDINRPIAFFLIMLAITAVFNFVGLLLAGVIGGAFISLIATLILAPIFLLLGVLIIHIIFKIMGGSGKYTDTLKIACYVTWLAVMMAFPLWAYLGPAVSMFVTILMIAAGAYMSIVALALTHELRPQRTAIPVVVIASLRVLVMLLGAFGTLKMGLPCMLGAADEAAVTSATASESSAAAAAPAEDAPAPKPVPNTAMVEKSPHVGKIVFSTSPIDPKKPANLTTAFKAGDKIYAAAFIKEPIDVLAKGSGPKPEFEIKPEVDGKGAYSQAGFSFVVKKDAKKANCILLDIAPAPAKMVAYKDPNVIYQKKFDKYGKKGGAMQLTKYLSNLPAGKHKIKLVLYRYGDLAVGEFEIDGDYKPYAALFTALEGELTKAVTLPKPKKSDKALEAAMAKVLKSSQVDWAREGKILRVVIINPEWFLVRHKISGVILHRYIQTDVIIKDKAGDCWIMRKTSFRQNYIGGKFQPLKLDGVMTGSGSKIKIPCDKVK